MSNHVELWNKCLDVIRQKVNKTVYNTWFTALVPYSYVDNKFTLQVPSHFFVEYIEENYCELLYNVMQNVIDKNVSLLYKVSVIRENSDLSTTLPTSKPQHRIETPTHTPNTPFANKNRAIFDSNLNAVYNFDNYIEGSTNKLARSAGLSIANSPGKSIFNPMFIYGESAVGKTHLANAIGLEVKYAQPEKRILYVSANLFQQQYTTAVHNNTTNDFLMFYQSIDLLIVDDIQDFCNKKQTQNTFFHIFNHLHQLGKQIIFCSDREPAKLQGMEDRILSRFKWGLTVEIKRPDYDLRLNILKHKIYSEGLDIANDVVEYIAQNVTTTVRDIEGVLTSLLAFSSFSDESINIDLARKVVSKVVEIPTEEQSKISIERICDVVCNYYALPIDEINSKSRKQKVSEARQVAMYLSRIHTNSPLSTIGQTIGKRDHSTVTHAFKTIRDQMDVDQQLTKRIHQIEEKLYS